MNRPLQDASSLTPSTLHSVKGAVLVIVLSFIVLLAGLVVAFFSRAVFDRQVSNNSANTTKVDLFARSAADVIICDLKQEIAAGSGTLAAVSGTATTPIYKMVSNQTAVPYRMASGTSPALVNLLKESAYNQPFYAGGNYDTTNLPAPNRAANLSSTTASLNNRVISLTRWNKPLMLPKKTPASASDLTPDPSFRAPDWVLVERSGTNPQTGNTNVIGRYAYTVYDEGGLLDINVAGYPTSMAASLTDYKNALAFADLTQLPQSPLQGLNLIDAMVGWRNYASIQPSGAFPNFAIPATSGSLYYSAIQANSFMRVSNTNLYNGQSDRMFCSRQDLLGFIQSIGDASQQATLQKYMQYLGTFSRDINQPSLVPAHIIDATAPAIVSNDGGNNCAGGDDMINPAFLTIRAGAGVTRNDGSTAVPGEPLVKKRFALSRLAWITCKGPSGNSTLVPITDPVFTETAKALGWEASKATAWLNQGTDDAVKKYFGLEWDNTNKRWNYAAHLTGTHISTLKEVAAAKREPDFVELLKASISAGALGKGATRYSITHSAPMAGANGITGALAWEDYQFRQDISLDTHIMQIAANIIDQFDADGYPTRIYFNDGTPIGTREIVGVEHLPYFYRIRSGVVKARLPVPAGATGAGGGKIPAPVLYTGASSLSDTGLMVYLLQPELWNPHDQNNPRATSASIAPTQFRFVADSTSPDLIGGSKPYPRVTIHTRTDATAYGTFYAQDANPVLSFDSYAAYQLALTSTNSELDFTVTAGTSNLFAEPTLLIRPGIPAGSNLQLGPQHSIRALSSPPLSGTFAKLTQAVTNGGGNGIKSVQDNNAYLGLYIAAGPLRWVAKNSGTNYVVSALNMGPSGNGWEAGWDGGITFRVQCQDAFGNWVTYDQKYSQECRNLQDIACTDNSGVANWASSYGLIGTRDYASCIDPRTARFGMQGGNGSSASYPYKAPGTASGFPSPLNLGQGIIYTNRWDNTPGAYVLNGTASTSYGYGLPAATGWYPKTVGQYWTSGTPFYFGLYAQNSINDDATVPQYYTDADGVVRRAVGAYLTGTTITTGQPLAIANTTAGAAAAQTQSRPIILNRPFRSVAELGYVFSGTPWKNLDMFTPESGFAGLLDVFCINDDTSTGVVAGKVNLNTRQEPVLEAILAGAYVDEMSHYSAPPSWKLSALAATDATTLASALVTRTKDSSTTKGPLRNIAELVGRWTGSVSASSGGIDGANSYHGFSEDLSSADAASNNIPRMREASLRALANCGTARVWNLMIDVIAQTGRYPATVTDPAKFIVEGERRYWLHVAIDRCTGEVLDQNLELVRE